MTDDRPPASRLESWRSWWTARSAILVMVLAVLIVSYASSLKAYLQQRHDIDALQSEIAERKTNIESLQDQLDRWEDPAYVEQQARTRFGFTMPGETAYVALDENGEVIEGTGELDDPNDVGDGVVPTPWWAGVWSSVEVAGDPPRQPAATIGGESEKKND